MFAQTDSAYVLCYTTSTHIESETAEDILHQKLYNAMQACGIYDYSAMQWHAYSKLGMNRGYEFVYTILVVRKG
jgi:hypothetical protein